MKFTIDAAALKAAFHFVSQAAARSDHLACVQIELLSGRIGMSATNAVRTAHVKIPVTETDGAGDALVPVGKFKVLVDSLGAAEVRVHVTAAAISFTQASANTSITLMDAALFPTVPKAAPKHASKLPSRALRRIMAATSYITPSASMQVSQEFLKAVQFVAEGGQLRTAASNGALVALAEAGCDVDTAWKALVPGEAIDLALACVDADEPGARIGIDDAQSRLFIECGSRVITVQLKDAPYTDLRKLIVKIGAEDALKGKPQFAWSTAAFTSALGRASAFANKVALSFDGRRENAVLGLSCASDDGGITDEIPVATTCTTPFRITCDPQFFARALKAVRVENVGASVSAERFIVLRTAPEEGGVRTSHLLLTINDKRDFYGVAPPPEAPDAQIPDGAMPTPKPAAGEGANADTAGLASNSTLAKVVPAAQESANSDAASHVSSGRLAKGAPATQESANSDAASDASNGRLAKVVPAAQEGAPTDAAGLASSGRLAKVVPASTAVTEAGHGT